MRLTNLVLLILILISILFVACNPKTGVTENVNAVTAEQYEEFDFTKKEAEEKFEREHTFRYSGYVRQIQYGSSRFSPSLSEEIKSHDNTFVGFEFDDGSVARFILSGVEPRLWIGAHVEIKIQQLYLIVYAGTSVSFVGRKDLNTDEPVYQLLEVRNLN